jgi:hypothetical protein
MRNQFLQKSQKIRLGAMSLITFIFLHGNRYCMYCIRVCVYAFVLMHNAQMCTVEVNALSLKDSFPTLRATAGTGDMNQSLNGTVLTVCAADFP